MPSPPYLLALLVTLCLTLATALQLRVDRWSARSGDDSVLKIALGEGRRLFANHFAVKADVYFHSGYYPSIFDQAAQARASASGLREERREHDHDGPAGHDESEHEKAMDFLGHPRDWIDRFGRNFYASKHSHLDQPGEANEILPWLRISAELDPQRIETYTVASWWMRERLGKVDEAERFLHEGLRANPTSYEILFELGDLFYKNRHDLVRARNVWEWGLRRYQEQDKAGRHPDIFVYQEIITHLSHVEEELGDLPAAIRYMEQERDASPTPESVQKQIDELKQKLAASKARPATK